MKPAWLILICTLCWGFWAFTEKMALRHMPTLSVQATGMAVYMALTPLMFLFLKTQGVPFVWNLPGLAWTVVTCLLAATAGIGFLYAIQSAPVYLVVGLTSVYPVVTFFLCWVFLGEALTLTKFAGMLTIVFGMWLVNR